MTSTARLRRLAAVAVAAPLALTLVACGGDGNDEPERISVEDLAASIDRGAAGDIMKMPDLPDEAVDCIATVIHDSDLSDETLDALADGDQEYQGDEKEQKIFAKMVTTMQEECEQYVPDDLKGKGEGKG